MPEVAHTMPLLVLDESDLIMGQACLSALSKSDPGGLLVLYNQGRLASEDLLTILNQYNLHAVILGAGTNIGIPRGRQACFKYIWHHFPEVKFISEIHADMLFPKNWIKVLVNYLESNDEPMICPGIMTSQGELHPEYKSGFRKDEGFGSLESLNKYLASLTYDAVIEGFVHPVLHRADTLKAIGGYDTRFLTGLQGYEDDSLLLAYRYYMGIRNNWRPKCCVKTRVYHATLAQRVKVGFDQNENLKGLINKYGIEGIKELSHIYPRNQEFLEILEAFRSD